MILRFLNDYVSLFNSIRRHYGDRMDTHERVFQHRNVNNVCISSNILHIRKSATNLFVTFSVNNVVLFSSSAGSAGSSKRERKFHFVIRKLCASFKRFIRYSWRTRETLSSFNNIIFQVNAPMKIAKSFIVLMRSFFRNVARNYNRKVLVDILKKNRANKKKNKVKYSLLPKRYRRYIRRYIRRHSHSAVFKYVVRYADIVDFELLSLNCLNNTILPMQAFFFNLFTGGNSVMPLNLSSYICIVRFMSSESMYKRVCVLYTIYVSKRLASDRIVYSSARNVGRRSTDAYGSLTECIKGVFAYMLHYYASLCTVYILFYSTLHASEVCRRTVSRMRRVSAFSVRSLYISCTLKTVRLFVYSTRSFFFLYGKYTLINISTYVTRSLYKHKLISVATRHCVVRYWRLFRILYVCLSDMYVAPSLRNVVFLELCAAYTIMCLDLNVEPRKRKVLLRLIKYRNVTHYLCKLWCKRGIQKRMHMRRSRVVLPNRLFFFNIVCFVNKSTKPFNGCRSSVRL